MTRWDAPAKLNLSLVVHPARDDGYHPLDSVVQTIDWCDHLEFEESDFDVLSVSDESLETSDNLIWRAVEAVRAQGVVPPLKVKLDKQIAVGSGLGGGSSDAAAAMSAASALAGTKVDGRTAAAIGADVPLFLEGGTQRMTGIGESLERLDPLGGFAIAVAVPSFRLSTVAVYRMWDELGGPVGPLTPDADLPEPLRSLGPIRNDLLPAALAIEEQLGDFIGDLEQEWGRTVNLTGSGSGCFAYFPNIEAAKVAAEAVASDEVISLGVALRSSGVGRSI